LQDILYRWSEIAGSVDAPKAWVEKIIETTDGFKTLLIPKAHIFDSSKMWASLAIAAAAWRGIPTDFQRLFFKAVGIRRFLYGYKHTDRQGIFQKYYDVLYHRAAKLLEQNGLAPEDRIALEAFSDAYKNKDNSII